MSRAYYEAEFGPLDGTEHTPVLGPRVEGAPAFLVFPDLLGDEFDDAPPPALKLRPVDPPPEAT
jgi:hypothetical protein